LQRGFAAKELEWAQEQDMAELETQDAACPYTAAAHVAEGMSEEALAQWMDSFPTEHGRRELAPAIEHEPKHKTPVRLAGDLALSPCLQPS
jgi:hypothetical protein